MLSADPNNIGASKINKYRTKPASIWTKISRSKIALLVSDKFDTIFLSHLPQIPLDCSRIQHQWPFSQKQIIPAKTDVSITQIQKTGQKKYRIISLEWCWPTSRSGKSRNATVWAEGEGPISSTKWITELWPENHRVTNMLDINNTDTMYLWLRFTINWGLKWRK